MLCSTSLLLSPAEARGFTDRYDAEIERSVHKWWGDFREPVWWKAQLWQESRLKPDAVSPAGARGLAQFMPGTWNDVTRKLGYRHAASPHEARLAIDAGAYYMASLRKQWRSERPMLDRNALAQASYNAGLGNILKAQRACQGARHWPEIATCLPQVTGHHSRETTDYVRLIGQWHGLMKAEGAR